MNFYLELLLIAAVVIFVVDLSGFTETWLGWLTKFTRRYNLPAVKSLRPFSCSLCMVWWCCLLWCLVRKNFTVPAVAASAALSFCSITVNKVLIFIREWSLWLLDKISPKW